LTSKINHHRGFLLCIGNAFLLEKEKRETLYRNLFIFADGIVLPAKSTRQYQEVNLCSISLTHFDGKVLNKILANKN
jgi:hypothetical protein